MRFWDLVFLCGAGGTGNPCYGVQARLVNFALHFQKFWHFGIVSKKDNAATYGFVVVENTIQKYVLKVYIWNLLFFKQEYVWFW